MLFKKLKRIIVAVLSALVIASSLYGSISMYNKLRPGTKVEQQIDMTEFKIKQVMNTNKLQTYEIKFSFKLTDTDWDRTKIFKDLMKTLTTRHLTVNGDYKAVFSYDLSKAQFIKNMDGTYTIKINSDDVECNVESLGRVESKEVWGLLGYYNHEDVSRVINQLNQTAKEKIFTQENVNTTINNAINNFRDLFKNVGVDTNKIRFESTDESIGCMQQVNVEKKRVLIYHTHFLEKYADKSSVYDVSEDLANKLKMKGIEIEHIDTDFSVDYNNAYRRSREMLTSKDLSQYSLILDIHRNAESVPTKANIDNTAQAMFVSTKLNPNRDNELNIINSIMSNTNNTYGIFKNVSEMYNHGIKYYNADLSDHSLLLELGNQLNTSDEIKSVNTYIADAIATYLNN